MHHRTLLLVLTTCAVAAGCRPDSPAARLARELTGAYPERAAPIGVVAPSTSRPRRLSCRWSRAASCGCGLTTAASPGPSSASGWARRCASASPTGCRNRRRSTGTASAFPTPWMGFPMSPSRRSSRAARSSTNSRPRTRARSGSTLTSVPASRSSAGSTACSSSKTPRRSRTRGTSCGCWTTGCSDETRQIFGRFNTPHDLMHDGRWGNFVTVNGRTDTRLDARAATHPPASAQHLERPRVRPRFRRPRSPDHRHRRAVPRAPDPARPFRAGSRQSRRSDVTLPIGPQSRSLPVVDWFYPDRPNHLADVFVDGVQAQPPAIVSVAGARARAGLVGGARHPGHASSFSSMRAGAASLALSGR